MTKKMGPQEKRVFKVVLTGGPCGGKSTGQARLCTFFENLGWKVYRVPETATVLLSGGIKFTDLSEDEAVQFQENLLKTMIQIENTFFRLAEACKKDCLVICDRGTMDAAAFINQAQWDKIMKTNGWNPVELRDTRYNLIIHMVSAANGAEDFYTTHDHAARFESLEEARGRDDHAAQAWIGHPYFDVIDNSTDFDAKLKRLIACVTEKLSIDIGDRLSKNSRKVKFLVSHLPEDAIFPPYQDFEVIHDYLGLPSSKAQARLRKRGQNGHWSYTHTIRRLEFNGQTIEVKSQISAREYMNMLPQRDQSHYTIYKRRRCFLFNNQYFQLDMYMEPCHPRCKGLMLLETYTTLTSDELRTRIPEFLVISREATGIPAYSMYNLSLRDDWQTSNKFTSTLNSPGSSEVTVLSRVNGHK